MSELARVTVRDEDDLRVVKYSLLSFASQGATALLQEFVFKRLTPHAGGSAKELTPDATVDAAAIGHERTAAH